MSQKVSILVLTNDLKLVKDLQTMTKSFAMEVLFYPCSSIEKFAEFGSKILVSAACIDESFYDPLTDSWATKIKQSFIEANRKSPFFLLSAPKDIVFARRVLQQGFEDILSKPIDSSLFFQKLQLYLPNQKFLKERLLFNMNVHADIALATTFQISSASEYGVTLQTVREIPRGSLFTIYGKLFAAQGEGSCLAKVLECSSQKNEKGLYEVNLVFVAPSHEVLTAVRLWLKHEYIRSVEAKQG